MDGWTNRRLRWSRNRAAAPRHTHTPAFKARVAPAALHEGEFTAEEFASAVLSKGVKWSMGGPGARRDNVIVERLWRSVKYERVYLMACDSVGSDLLP